MRKILISIFFLLVSSKGFSQENFNSPYRNINNKFLTADEVEQLRMLDSFYLAESGAGRDFINGRVYYNYYFRSEKKPILNSGEVLGASLVYNGREYKDLILQYDTFLDQVIYSDNSMVWNNRAYMVILNRYNTGGFVLYIPHDTLTFRYFSSGSDPGFNLSDGFYEVVYDGRCKYLIKHSSVNYKLKGVDEYSYHPESFVKTGDKFVRITSRKEFVSLFGDESKSIKRFISENRIRIHKGNKSKIADILKFYESIATGIY